MKIEFELSQKQEEVLHGLEPLADADGMSLTPNQVAKRVFLEFLINASTQKLRRELADEQLAPQPQFADKAKVM